LSAPASFTSATGTYLPSIWQKESPNCSLAMSFRPGSFSQPEAVEIGGASTVAPQREQLSWPPSMDAPHHGQIKWRRSPACGWIDGAAESKSCRSPTCGWTGGAAARFTWEPHDPQKFAVSEIFVP